METTHIDEVIILRKLPYREYDGLITVYSSLDGRLNLVARGIQRSASKLSGHLEALTCVKIMIVRGKHFDYIGSALNLNSYLNLRSDLPALLTAGRAMGLALQLLKNRSSDIEVYGLLKNTLQELNKTDGIKEDRENLFYYFVFKFLSFLGYELDLSVYSKQSAKRKISNKYFFDVKNGSLSGDKNTEGKISLDFGTIKAMQDIYQCPFEQMARIKIEKSAKSQLKQVLSSYLHYSYGLKI